MAGRPFEDRAEATRRPVAIVNHTLAARRDAWAPPGRIGSRIRVADGENGERSSAWRPTSSTSGSTNRRVPTSICRFPVRSGTARGWMPHTRRRASRRAGGTGLPTSRRSTPTCRSCTRRAGRSDGRRTAPLQPDGDDVVRVRCGRDGARRDGHIWLVRYTVSKARTRSESDGARRVDFLSMVRGFAQAAVTARRHRRRRRRRDCARDDAPAGQRAFRRQRDRRDVVPSRAGDRTRRKSSRQPGAGLARTTNESAGRAPTPVDPKARKVTRNATRRSESPRRAALVHEYVISATVTSRTEQHRDVTGSVALTPYNISVSSRVRPPRRPGRRPRR